MTALRLAVFFLFLCGAIFAYVLLASCASPPVNDEILQAALDGTMRP